MSGFLTNSRFFCKQTQHASWSVMFCWLLKTTWCFFVCFQKRQYFFFKKTNHCFLSEFLQRVFKKKRKSLFFCEITFKKQRRVESEKMCEYEQIIRHGTLDQLRRLAATKLFAITSTGDTAIHIAVACNNIQAMQYFLCEYPNLAFRLNNKNQSPLHVAVQTHNGYILSVLMSKYPQLLMSKIPITKLLWNMKGN